MTWGIDGRRNNGGPKLDHEKVRTIRERAERGEQQAVLAKEYGVHKTTINGIIKGRSWKTA